MCCLLRTITVCRYRLPLYSLHLRDGASHVDTIAGASHKCWFFPLSLMPYFSQALPDAEEWLRHNMIAAMGSMLIKAPAKVFKGTVNTAHTIATKSIRGVGGLVNHTGVSTSAAVDATMDLLSVRISYFLDHIDCCICETGAHTPC